MPTTPARPAGAYNPHDVPTTAPGKATEAPATDQAQPHPAETTPVTAGTDVYRARRRRAAAIALVAIAAGWYAWTTKPWDAVQATTEATTTGVATVDAAAQSVIDTDMGTAHRYLAEHGAFDGIALDGAQVASRGQTLYVARVIDGSCTAYGVLDGVDLAPAVDPTGQACAGQIVAVQAQLDQAAFTATTTAQTQARDTLKSAADTVTAYAARNFVDGVPSTTGLPAVVNGAIVVTNTGDYVVLRASYPAACLEMHVTAAGQASSPTTCP